MYGKLYESTFTGSMVGTGAHVFAVWGYVIANTKPDSIVELNPVLISAMIGEDVTRIQDAIGKLCSDDPQSRTKKYQGRRLIKRGEFLYFVPNYLKYRGLPNDQARKEYFAEKQREHRKRVASCQTGMSKLSNIVKQAEAESNKQKKKAARRSPLPFNLDEWLTELQKLPCYASINVRNEFGKAQTWCNVRGLTLSKQRFVNWINKAEKPIGGNGVKQRAPVYPKLPPSREPTPEEIANARAIARQETEKLREKLKTP